MLSFLKPTKANLAGTAALLIANWAGGLVSRYAISPLIFQVAGGAMQGGGRGAGGAAMMPFGGFGLAAGAANLVILAVLFYVILSFILAEIAKSPETQKAKS
jgi:hypothetical protein